MSLLDKRKAAGITQNELADTLRIDRSTVAKWETGKAYPRAALLPKIAQVLGCTIDELLQYQD